MIWAPYLYLDKATNQITGISHDLIQIIGKKLNFPVEFLTDLPWKRVLNKVKVGELYVCAAYWNEER